MGEDLGGYSAGSFARLFCPQLLADLERARITVPDVSFELHNETDGVATFLRRLKAMPVTVASAKLVAAPHNLEKALKKVSLNLLGDRGGRAVAARLSEAAMAR